MTFREGKFWCNVPTAQKAGWLWSERDLQWSTRSIFKANQLRQFADAGAELKLKKQFITTFPLPEQILYPDHLHPKLFQIESAFHCLTRAPAYLADEQGLGKTITSVLCMNTVPGKTLVICPPFLKYNWAEEIEKWSYHPISISVIQDGGPLETAFDADVVVVPDSIITVPRILGFLNKRRFEWLFVDEAHRYKNGDAKRTQALLQSESGTSITDLAKRVIYLSGTPIPNGKPIEMYPILGNTALEAIGHQSRIEFGKCFCNGRLKTHYDERGRPTQTWDFNGTSNLSLLQKRLRAKFMVRHLKKDVLEELPPKTRKIIFLDAPTTHVNFEKKFLNDHPLEDVMGNKLTLGDISTLQCEIGMAKVSQAIFYIRELLDEMGEKVVVFAHHIRVVMEIEHALKEYGALMIRGGLTALEKQERVKSFQDNPKTRVIIGNMEAMGVGLTLTRAPHVIVVEPSWVPGVNQQAEDRVHRMTQAKNVYIQYLVMRNSLDERKLRSVLNKEGNISQVMGA